MTNITPLEFPKNGHIVLDDGTKMFPPLYMDMDDIPDWTDGLSSTECGEYKHPILDLVANGAAINAIELVDDWIDDHALCVSCIITIDNKPYGVSLLWLDRKVLKTIYTFNPNDPKSVRKIKDLLNPFGDQ